MNARPVAILAAGAAFCGALALAVANLQGPGFVAALQSQAEAARDRAGGHGVTLSFRDGYGWLTRHPVLSGGERLDAETRGRVAAAVDTVPGIGGIIWAGSSDRPVAKLHCQDDVEAILKARSIRFAEASAMIDPTSERLLDEVAGALLPCVGSIIAVTGHTDGNGNPAANRSLSLARAEAVRWALIGRGIPADGLRAAGMGSTQPIEGLDSGDPANRRIEFSVIASAPIKPTPIDTPGAG